MDKFQQTVVVSSILYCYEIGIIKDDVNIFELEEVIKFKNTFPEDYEIIFKKYL
jgi:hypothetical protein